jgi:penicillin-binding protein 1C
VVRTAVRFDHDLEAPREELFLAGSETTRIVRSNALAAKVAAERSTGLISAPVDGTVVALDPDIPPTRQRMTFRAVAHGAQVQWRLDGRLVGRGAQMEWALWPGKHRLELLDATDRIVDGVAFEVRGADVRGSDGKQVVARR